MDAFHAGLFICTFLHSRHSTNSKRFRNITKLLIDGPKIHSRRGEARCDKVCIRQTYPCGSELPRLNQNTHIRKANRTKLNELIQKMKSMSTIRQRSKRKLRNQKRMNAELVGFDESLQFGFVRAITKHPNPNGSIGKNHSSSTRSLRTSSISGAVPANASNRRPASRAISDFRASRSSAALSVTPLYSSAVFNKLSSSDTVARTEISLHQF